MKMKQIRLTRHEKVIEGALVRGEYEDVPVGKLTQVRDLLPPPAKLRHPHRDRKIKDKKSSGCALCKPWKHGWTNERGKGRPPILGAIKGVVS